MLKRGFTLIELLVVIAIIGILASIILISVGGARSKGGDAAVQANLNTVQTQMEYDNSASGYGTAIASAACPTTGTSNFVVDTTMANALAQAKASGSGTATCAIGIAGASYAVAASLKTDSTKSWCVDSNGNAKQEAAAAPALNGGAVAAACP